jgi:hypothetical protein
MFIGGIKIFKHSTHRKLELKLKFHGWITTCIYDHNIDSLLFVLK